jgi:peptidoglycan/LPS O-acetylase OafA/YrhL
MRGVASLSVCVFHLTTFPFPTPNGALYTSLADWTRYGWLGVEVFFVVSGFVIPWSLRRAGYRLRDYPTFILKRLVRLDPPYLLSIALVLAVAFVYTRHAGLPFLVEGSQVTWRRLLLHLGYLNAFGGGPWLNPVYWTLAVEFQFYLMIGLCFPPLSSRRRRLRLGSSLCLALAFLVFGGAVSSPAAGGSSVFSFGFLFLMGILLFQHMAGLSGRAECVTMLALSTAGCYLTLGLPPTLAGDLTSAVIFTRKRESKVGTFFGEISYSLYLLHWLVGPVVLSVASSKLFDTQEDSGKLLVLFCALAACVVASAAFYAAVERPSRRISSKMRYGGKGEPRVPVKC